MLPGQPTQKLEGTLCRLSVPIVAVLVLKAGRLPEGWAAAATECLATMATGVFAYPDHVFSKHPRNPLIP